jgi:hypothetical protein
LRLGEGDAGLEAAKDVAVLIAFDAGLRFVGNDKPGSFDFVGGAGRNDADDGVRLIVNKDGLAEDVGIGVIAAFPEAMGEEDEVILAGRALGIPKSFV